MSGALHLTSKEKLNNELSWESIKIRADFLGLTLFHKIATSKTRPLVRSCLPKQKLNPDSLRSGNLMQFPYLGEKYAKSFSRFSPSNTTLSPLKLDVLYQKSLVLLLQKI